MAEILTASGASIGEAPEPIYNCPQCSHWIPTGALACPDCQTIIYSDYLRKLAIAATSAERDGNWAIARDAWQRTLSWLPLDSTQVATIQGKVDDLERRIQAGERQKATWTRRLGPFAPVAFFLLKIKSGLFLLFKLKFLLSFFAFFGLYWAIFGWRFGLGFALSILIHEMGHYVAARVRGLKVDLPVFLPGLGAYVRWYSMGIPLDDLAGIALAGPFFGLMAAAVCGGVAVVTGSPLFAALAHTGAWLNLLNLVPLLGLDGAQATYALSRLQRGLVLATSVIMLIVSHEFVFLFVALGMAWRTFTGPEPTQSSVKTMVRYILLLFILSTIINRFPDVGRRF